MRSTTGAIRAEDTHHHVAQPGRAVSAPTSRPANSPGGCCTRVPLGSCRPPSGRPARAGMCRSPLRSSAPCAHPRPVSSDRLGRCPLGGTYPPPRVRILGRQGSEDSHARRHTHARNRCGLTAGHLPLTPFADDGLSVHPDRHGRYPTSAPLLNRIARRPLFGHAPTSRSLRDPRALDARRLSAKGSAGSQSSMP